MASPTIHTLTSFSGADLVATFANKVIGELMQITWAVQRDKAPVFTCGSPDARSFSRGKRGIAGSMVFAVFDHDSLVATLQSVWDKIAPPAMFTAAGNIVKNGTNEDFTKALDMVKWNNLVSEIAERGAVDDNAWLGVEGEKAGYGFSFGSTTTGAYTNTIDAQKARGSNNIPKLREEDGLPDYGVAWDDSNDEIFVPAGFAPIRGENVVYADTLPPFDITMTFASEYGHTAFQKIYDVDILNESSGAGIETVIMNRQVTWIARRMSPLIRGVYTRDEAGNMRGVLPTDAADSNVTGTSGANGTNTGVNNQSVPRQADGYVGYSYG